jgi:two-component system alkaline phosphatase synthesis response regulator PhoP
MEKEFVILLVDDEEDILEFLSYNLKKEGFVVYTAKNGRSAIQKAREYKPHLIILDVMMPEMDGIEACSEIRQIPELKDTFIMFLTARSEDYSHIAGLEAGADDYIAKPIRPKVFVARVKTLLRRFKGSAEVISGEDEKSEVLDLGEIKVDKEKYLVYKNDISIELPRKEFEILLLLSGKPNKVFTREEIYNKIWGESVIVGDRTIDVHMSKLRELLGVSNIKTVKGVGYKYELK